MRPRRDRRQALAGAALALALGWGPGPSGADCGADCAGDLSCEQRVARCLQERGRGREAVDRLKEVVTRYPERADLARLLAAAYLAAGNPFWAQRTLTRLLERDPGDCDSRAWLAWSHLQQGDLDLAAQALDASTLAAGGCPASAPDRARWAFLRLQLAVARRDSAAWPAALADLERSRALYREDAGALGQVRRRLDPDWLAPCHLRADLGLGATTAAAAGLPTAVPGPQQGALLARLDLGWRLAAPAPRGHRAVMEWGLRGHCPHGLGAGPSGAVAAARYLELSARPGLLLGSGPWRGTLAYRAEVFILNQADARGSGPQVHHEGHRAEAEVEAPGGWLAFGGAGRRLFRQRARSRWETDGGVGWSGSPRARSQLLLALSLRRHPAEARAYTHGGGALLAVAQWRLPGDRRLRAGATLSRDGYARTAAGPGGRDLLVQASLQAWSPPRLHGQWGVAYEYSRRSSSCAH